MGGFLVAGTGSGSGKTTISMGIMAALKNRGEMVAPFKVGPDYIDPGFHSFVTGTASHNLDIFMTGEHNVRYIYNKYLGDSIGVVEGVMGMFDGLSSSSFSSSGHVAKVLGIPTVLIIDGRGVSNSAAAMVKGFDSFEDGVGIDYVIVNRVSSENHYNIIKSSIEKNTNAQCVGYLPNNDKISLNSRHLGLIPSGEVEGLQSKIDEIASLIEDYIDLDVLIKACNIQEKKEAKKPQALDDFIQKNGAEFSNLIIGVASDIAFTFYYKANIDLLAELGAKIVYFSPLSDKKLPDGLDFVYIGGGFPEVFSNKLEVNKSFRADLKSRLEGGLKCYAECGGFMYLTNSITGLDEKTNKTVGFFDADSKMTKRLQRFGYVTLEYNGVKLNAHEFHRSQTMGELDYRYEVSKSRDGKVISKWQCGAKKANTLAGYPHIHFYSNFDFLREVFIDG